MFVIMIAHQSLFKSFPRSLTCCLAHLCSCFAHAFVLHLPMFWFWAVPCNLQLASCVSLFSLSLGWLESIGVLLYVMCLAVLVFGWNVLVFFSVFWCYYAVLLLMLCLAVPVFWFMGLACRFSVTGSPVVSCGDLPTSSSHYEQPAIHIVTAHQF